MRLFFSIKQTFRDWILFLFGQYAGSLSRREHPRNRSMNLVRWLSRSPKDISSFGQKENITAQLANIIDISHGGVQMTTQQPMARNTVLGLSIHFASENASIEIDGKVMWCRRISRLPQIYHCGISFLEMPPDVREKFEDLLKRQTGGVNAGWIKKSLKRSVY